MPSRKPIVFFATIVLIVGILTGFVVGTNFSVPIVEGSNTLNVEVTPRSVKLSVAQPCEFTAHVYNGSAPYIYYWEATSFLDENTTLEEHYFVGDSNPVTFMFTESCAYAELSVTVKDSSGNVGFSTVIVCDPNVFTLSSGVYPGAPDYTFFREGVTYYAKNIYGAISYSGTNVSSIIQSIYDGFVTSNGVGLFLKFASGNFVFSVGVTIAKHTETWNTSITIEGSTVQYGTNLVKDFDGDLFTLGDGVDRIGYITFKNLYFNGGDYTGQLIDADTVNALSVYDCRFENVNGTAIRLESVYGGGCQWQNTNVEASGNATTTEPAIDIVGDTNAIEFYNSGFSVNNYIGVNISSTASSIGFYKIVAESSGTYPLISDYGLGTRIIGCSLSNIDSGCNLIELRGTRTVVSGNALTTGAMTGTAIYIASSFAGEITGNHIYSSSYGIYVNEGYPVITGNGFWDNTEGVHVDNALVNIGDNEFYYSRNESINIYLSYQSIVSNNLVVNNGYGSGASSHSGIYLNATQFVNCEGNMLYDWQGTKTMKWGIEEAGADWNNIVGCTAIGGGVGGIYQAGANTEVHSCFNSTTYVT